MHISTASISTIMCDVSSKVELILSCLEDKNNSVKNIVLMEKPDVELVGRAKQFGIHLTSMEEMEVSTLFLKTLCYSVIQHMKNALPHN